MQGDKSTATPIDAPEHVAAAQQITHSLFLRSGLVGSRQLLSVRQEGGASID
jgi:hypothetical protein